jgi:LmbE family N-acetylglucosaminyl deacetylase
MNQWGWEGRLQNMLQKALRRTTSALHAGRKAGFGPEEQNPGLSALGQLRTKELENAIKELGMKGLYFLDDIDGEVDQADYAEAIRKIVAHIRRIKPQVVVTFPPDGNYGHPDHIVFQNSITWSIQRILSI